MKIALLVLGWVASCLALYGGLTALEFYWNVPDWQPRFDAIATGISLWTGGALLAIGWLSRVSHGKVVRATALILCLALAALAFYVLPAEPLKAGLLGRESASPLWYRLGRLMLLLLPTAFWVLGSRGKQRF